jgi:hypothetical protein
MKANKNIKTLAEFKDEYYGKIGTPKRNKLDKGFEALKCDVIRQTKIKHGLLEGI